MNKIFIIIPAIIITGIMASCVLFDPNDISNKLGKNSNGSGGGGGGGSGNNWTIYTITNGEFFNGITSSADGSQLAVGGDAGDIFTSSDYGATWQLKKNINAGILQGITSSADGSHLFVVDRYYGYISTSADHGNSWTYPNTILPTDGNWYCITSSADGSRLASGSVNGDIYISTDFWVDLSKEEFCSGGSYTGIASSADGSRLAACDQGGDIWASVSGGTNWKDMKTVSGATSPSTPCYSIASSTNGVYLAAAAYGGYIWTSVNAGTNWTQHNFSANWNSITSSADGSHLAAVVSPLSGGGDIWISSDYGATWSDQASAGSRIWLSITSSADGSRLAAVDETGIVAIYKK
ncbi:MAG: hypothetical protein ABSG94_07080 [Brevinematales bacterium]|jgi:hypothetical protein